MLEITPAMKSRTWPCFVFFESAWHWKNNGDPVIWAIYKKSLTWMFRPFEGLNHHLGWPRLRSLWGAQSNVSLRRFVLSPEKDGLVFFVCCLLGLETNSETSGVSCFLFWFWGISYRFRNDWNKWIDILDEMKQRNEMHMRKQLTKLR